MPGGFHRDSIDTGAMATSTLRDPSGMSFEDIDAEVRALLEAERVADFEWQRRARPEQLEPADYEIWAIMAGRGWGKTRTGAETVRGWASELPGGQFAAVARTHRECLKICYRAPRSGLVSVTPPADQAEFLRSSGSPLLRYANGAVVHGFSSQDPDAIRGYELDGAWIDEYGHYLEGAAEEVVDNLWMAMRAAARPRMVITFTPRRAAHVRQLLKDAETDPMVVVTRGRTRDNTTLSERALRRLERVYAGTRLGRQELEGELVEDVEGALWQAAWIERGRVAQAAELVRTVVAIDPADTTNPRSDETGIVVAGRGVDGHDYVLADRSGRVAGMTAARRIWRAWVDYHADEVVYEGSSDWIRDTLADAWQAMQHEGILPEGAPPMRSVQATASKKVRATPVAARYEQEPARVHHVGVLQKLEDQMTTWVPESGARSPDRMDALVYALTHLRGREGQQASIEVPASGAVTAVIRRYGRW